MRESHIGLNEVTDPNPAEPEPICFSLKENDPDFWFTVGFCPYLFREIQISGSIFSTRCREFP